jgi:phosphoribosylamine-glycine ligase
MLSGRAFGEAGRRIVIEEMLYGREASLFVLADGTRRSSSDLPGLQASP